MEQTEELQAKHMRRAMKVLEQFSEQKESYYQYLERFNIRANQISQQAENEAALAERNKAVAELEDAKIELNHTTAELNRTTAELEQATAQIELQKVEAARKLIQLGNFSAEQIANISALSLEQVKKLIDDGKL